MAIFAGDWHDGDGVPFDPRAYQCQDYGASGTAQNRSVRPYRTLQQRLATFRFAKAAKLWFDYMSEDDRQKWRDDAPVFPFFERHGNYDTWYGYRTFMRTQVACYTAGVDLHLDGPFFGDPWDIELVSVKRQPGDGMIVVAFYNYQENTESRSHLEVFQIRPDWVGRAYEVDGTRKIMSVAGWADGERYVVYYMDPHWFLPTRVQYRVLIRWWNVHLCGQTVVTTEAE